MSKYCPVHDRHDDPDVDRGWHVYTCFAADGTPLYVGVTEDVASRLLWHARYTVGSSAWYYYCARVEASAAFKCRWDAHAAEVAEIGRLRPAFNKHHNPAPQPWAVPDVRTLRYSEIPPIAWLDSLPTERASA